MEMASTEIAWAWLGRGNEEKAFAVLKNVNFDEVGSRATSLLSCLLARKGDKAARMAQLVFLENCNSSDDGFLQQGPFFTSDERKVVADFLANQKSTLVPANRTNGNQ